MKVTVLSDTHQLQGAFAVPEDTDLLIHCGDFTNQGKIQEITRFSLWLSRQPAKHKVVIAGNHDILFEKSRDLAKTFLPPDVHYLENSGVEIEGLKLWGSPWTPAFMGWGFNGSRRQLREIWAQIPEGLDILITHGPPQGILDKAGPENLGCIALLDRLIDLKEKPRYHLFGHIHEGRGTLIKEHTIFINAANLNGQYRPAGDPVTFNLEPRFVREEE